MFFLSSDEMKNENDCKQRQIEIFFHAKIGARGKQNPGQIHFFFFFQYKSKIFSFFS